MRCGFQCTASYRVTTRRTRDYFDTENGKAGSQKRCECRHLSFGNQFGCKSEEFPCSSPIHLGPVAPRRNRARESGGPRLKRSTLKTPQIACTLLRVDQPPEGVGR